MTLSDFTVEIARSFSQKIQTRKFESADFFASAKATCPFSQAQEMAAVLYDFCRSSVRRDIVTLCEQMNIAAPEELPIVTSLVERGDNSNRAFSEQAAKNISAAIAQDPNPPAYSEEAARTLEGHSAPSLTRVKEIQADIERRIAEATAARDASDAKKVYELLGIGPKVGEGDAEGGSGSAISNCRKCGQEYVGEAETHVCPTKRGRPRKVRAGTAEEATGEPEVVTIPSALSPAPESQAYQADESDLPEILAHDAVTSTDSSSTEGVVAISPAPIPSVEASVSQTIVTAAAPAVAIAPSVPPVAGESPALDQISILKKAAGDLERLAKVDSIKSREIIWDYLRGQSGIGVKKTLPDAAYDVGVLMLPGIIRLLEAKDADARMLIDYPLEAGKAVRKGHDKLRDVCSQWNEGCWQRAVALAARRYPTTGGGDLCEQLVGYGPNPMQILYTLEKL